MKRRRHYIRTRPPLLRWFLIGVLVLWIGRLVFGVLSYQPPTELDLRGDAAKPAFEAPRRARPATRPPAQHRFSSAGDRPAARGSPNVAARPEAQSSAAPTPAPARQATKRAATVEPPNVARPVPAPSTDASPDSVAQAQFTTAIVDQQPINSIRAVFSTNDKVYSLDGRPIRSLYYYTEIRGMRDETVTHRWERNGQVVAETSFKVGGDPWSVYSHEDLTPGMEGEWQVVVTDAQSHVIRTDSFSFQGF